jgi:hypothetical protein
MQGEAKPDEIRNPMSQSYDETFYPVNIDTRPTKEEIARKRLEEIEEIFRDTGWIND